MKTTASRDVYEDCNPDPITGAPGAHPIGTGVGAAAVGTAGAAIGTLVGGPAGGIAGGILGAAVGSLIGGLAGKEVAEAIDPTVEDAYWNQAHSQEPYFDHNYTFDDYRPAYRVGYGTYPEFFQLGRPFENSENDLKSEFERTKGASRLDWEKAKPATRAAWHRLGAERSPSVNEVEPSQAEMPTSPPASTDQVEQLAAELASQEDHKRVTDEDRERAYKQMEKRSPKIDEDGQASH